MASAGSSELGVVVRQTTHWRSAPSKSHPALLVAHICVFSQLFEKPTEKPFSPFLHSVPTLLLGATQSY